MLKNKTKENSQFKLFSKISRKGRKEKENKGKRKGTEGKIMFYVLKLQGLTV